MKPGQVSDSPSESQASGMEILPLLSACELDDLTRIDVGLEGDWSRTVQVAWTREGRSQVLDTQRLEHASFRPSLELYFKDGWLGLHCFRRCNRKNVLDEEALARVINLVEAAL